MPAPPAAQGLYDPRYEHDACGVAMVATLSGVPSHTIVDQGLTALRNLEHRGASGADPDSGDGAGILLQVPDEFLRAVVEFPLPPKGAYVVGAAFLPADDPGAAQEVVEQIAVQEGMTVLGWRDVPTVPDLVGPTARAVMPVIRQLFLAPAGGRLVGLGLERLAYAVRKRADHETAAYFPSLSARTLVYKGMLTATQLEPFFPDLSDRRLASALVLVHSRFSTNTFPSWPLAHPYRYIAHNGEINTLRGNRNWMHARESQLASDVLPGDLTRLFPICTEGASDSASFDEVLELLHLAGRPLPHAVLMMIPEAWENHTSMDPAPPRLLPVPRHLDGAVGRTGLRHLHRRHRDRRRAGPQRSAARPLLGDRRRAGRAGQRGRACSTSTRRRSCAKGRLQPGRMFLVDTAQGRIVEDDEVKSALAAEHPYDDWLHAGLLHLEDLPEREHVTHTHESVVRRQQTFGYTDEELRVLLAPMARTGAEAIGSMGTDTPVAVLSDKPRLLFDYFTQMFAQVTNPPLDAIREELVTSLGTMIGPEQNLLEPGPASCRQVVLPFPVIDNDELAKLVRVNADGDLPGFRAAKVRGLYRVHGGGDALARRLEEVCAEVSAAIAAGSTIIVLSDRDSDTEHAPIPSLLLTAAVHHHLVRCKERTRCSIVVETGDVREVHHVALLIGYGASAVNPYLAMESAEDLVRSGVVTGVTPEQAIRNLIKALGKGVLKVMSKMGISTVASYQGAQVFEAVGLAPDLVERYFTGTTSRLGGIGLDVIAVEVRRRHEVAYPPSGISPAHRSLAVGGEYQWRREGEPHLFDPDTVFRLQHATRTGRYDVFKQYTARVDEQAERLMTVRGLFRFAAGARPPVPLDEVEPVESIVHRFSTGAMSYGSISQEAHETLAVAMNRMGARSNTGEGGEDPERYVPLPDGDSRRSAVKQVASGRFGVTSEYLVNADDLQIKMAQGAKPGEGGQLPGHKVYPWIAKTRHSTPGVGLISPPPHHDIYSIEDLAQLIYDLKNANPVARVHVKLVSEVGVGTVAAGVAKAHADVVLISGHDGGTGASPLTSLKHAGTPWELGLAETQQTLLRNGLRDRVVVQTDGQLKTGRDVVVAALLGAEEFGFATAPLVVMGCVMMRVCHLDTCPVGVATQNPELRKRFTGKPEFVQTFFEYLAEEVRELLAALGFRTLEEAVGHAELLDVSRAVEHWKAAGLDLAPVLHVPETAHGVARHCTTQQDHGLDKALDNQLIELCAPALDNAEPVRATLTVRNVNRTVGTMLGSQITRRHGGGGLPDGTVDLTFVGSAGQSFGAFLPSGVTLRLEGDANDYVGKGLSGGRVVVRPDRAAGFAAEANVLAGNVILYGATSGEAFLRGVVGERFAVRNSGARAVVEGVGDHACEYMTGGRVVIIGPTGRNLAAGMSGGIAYVLDLDPALVNRELVDLEPVQQQDEDAGVLLDLVARHAEETGSPVAAELLADGPAVLARFTRVMPRDYRRVLVEAARSTAAGGELLGASRG